jgi:hypothetical protein
MPRLTGYLLFGLLVGPYLGNVITEVMARTAPDSQRHCDDAHRVIAGLTLNIERLERACARSGPDDVVTLGIAMGGPRPRWPWICGRGCRLRRRPSGTAKLAMIALMVVIVVSFSPTMSAGRHY